MKRWLTWCLIECWAFRNTKLQRYKWQALCYEWWKLKKLEDKWGRWGLEHSGETSWRGWYFCRVFKGWGSSCLWLHVFKVQDFLNIALSEALCSRLRASGGLLECKPLASGPDPFSETGLPPTVLLMAVCFFYCHGLLDQNLLLKF